MTNEDAIIYSTQEQLDYFARVVRPDVPVLCIGTFRVDKRVTVIRYENETEEFVTIVVEPKR